MVDLVASCMLLSLFLRSGARSSVITYNHSSLSARGDHMRRRRLMSSLPGIDLVTSCIRYHGASVRVQGYSELDVQARALRNLVVPDCERSRSPEGAPPLFLFARCPSGHITDFQCPPQHHVEVGNRSYQYYAFQHKAYWSFAGVRI